MSRTLPPTLHNPKISSCHHVLVATCTTLHGCSRGNPPRLTKGQDISPAFFKENTKKLLVSKTFKMAPSFLLLHICLDVHTFIFHILLKTVLDLTSLLPMALCQPPIC